MFLGRKMWEENAILYLIGSGALLSGIKGFTNV